MIRGPARPSRPSPIRSVALLVAVAILTLPSGASSQIRRPDLRIPGADRLAGMLERLTRGEPALSTSIADAVNGVPELDDYDPREPSPMVELPRSPDGDLLLFPGTYYFHPESFCLHAGTQGPRRGDGYLYAPLQGSEAPILEAILRRSYHHPEITQREIQRLLWAVLARTKPSDMADETRRTALALLTAEELARLNGVALDLLGEEVLRRLADEVPPEVYRVLRAENEIRGMVARSGVPYEEMERVAVLTGVLADDESNLPWGRWSYHPEGYFIRYLVESYPNTRVEAYLPETFQVERTDDGQIRLITDGVGNDLVLEYEDGAWARGALLRPSGGGGAAGGAARLAGVRLRPSAAGIREGLRPLAWRLPGSVAVSVVGAGSGSGRVAATGSSGEALRLALLTDLLDLRAVAEGVASAGAPEDVRVLLAEAWHRSLLDLYTADRGSARAQARRLPSFNGPGQVGVPGGPRQRGGLNNRQNKNHDDALSRAQAATSWISGWSDAVSAVTSRGASVPGGILHGTMVGGILDFIFGNGREISDALSGDPPRDDYRELARPRHVALPVLPPEPGVSEARAAAARAMLDAGARSIVLTEAAVVTLDRLGGAQAAGDEAWVERQGRLLVHLKREVGTTLVRLGDALDRWIAASRADGVPDVMVTAEMIEEARARVRAEGAPAAVVEAARALGLPEAGVDVWMDTFLSSDASGATGSLFVTLGRAADGFRDLGSHFGSLPVVPDPWAGPGG